MKTKLSILLLMIGTVYGQQTISLDQDTVYYTTLPQTIDLGKVYISYNFTYVPKLVLPDTIYVTTTANLTIYGDNIINYDIGDDRLRLSYTCDAGVESGNDFVLNNISAGNYDLNIKAQIGDSIFDDRNIVLKSSSPQTISDTLSIVYLGNSLTYLGRNYTIPTLRTALGKAKNYGTIGTAPNLNEGHSGWTFTSFVIDGSPFYVVDSLDFTSYRRDTIGLSSPLNILIIQLGINDIIMDDVNLYDIYGHINQRLKMTINAALLDTTENIFINLEPICENSGDGWYDDYGTTRNQNFYIYKMNRLWQMIINEFDNGKYDPAVKVAYGGMFINRDTHYLKTNGIHSSGVHLTNPGYTMLGTAVYNSINGRIIQ